MTSATRHLLGAAALLATAALTAACGPANGNSATGNSTATPTATPTTTAPASPASSPAPTGGNNPVTAGCSASALTAHVDLAQSGAAAGSVYVPIDFTNTSGSPCTMDGYPGVSFVRGRSGGQLGNAASRNPAAAPAMVTLAPGGIAHAILQVGEAGNYSAKACTPVAAHWLKIFPPNQAGAIYARYDVQACSAKLPARLGSQLDVYVVRPGAGKAGHAP